MAAPSLFNDVAHEAGYDFNLKYADPEVKHTAVVIMPLVSLIDDQAKCLTPGPDWAYLCDCGAQWGLLSFEAYWGRWGLSRSVVKRWKWFKNVQNCIRTRNVNINKSMDH